MTALPPLTGRVHVVTGATSGIGQVVAREMAGQGATVLLVGRDPARGEATLTAIRETHPMARVELFLADLSSQPAVRTLAGEIRGRHPVLHGLIHNAAVIPARRRLTVDGHEETFAVNHLAPFLLTDLLREPLLAGSRDGAPDDGDARIVTVSSEAHRMMPNVEWNNFRCERRFRAFWAYAHSKLANILFTRELARRLAGTGLTANCLHPGIVRTGLWRETGGLLGLVVRLGRPMMVSPEQGAAPVVHLATAPGLAGESGGYYHGFHESGPSPAGCDDAAAARLWEVSTEMTAAR